MVVAWLCVVWCQPASHLSGKRLAVGRKVAEVVLDVAT